MLRDFWEFMDKETKAQIVFGGAIFLVVMVIAIPYFITVLNNRQPEVAVEPTDYTATEENPKSDESTEPIDEKEVTNLSTDAESAPETSTSENASTTYAYYAPVRSTASTQPTHQSASAPEPTEKITRTTVDDRSAGDDGYTATGIDSPGSDSEMITSDSETTSTDPSNPTIGEN